jgi:hypothetical protein
MPLILTKPDVRHVWSSLGNRTEIDINDRTRGWVQEIPPHEVMNSVDYNQDLALKYLFQEGFAEWDANFEYNRTSITKYRGIVYQLTETAEVPNKGKRPDQSPESWAIAFEPFGSSDSLREVIRKMQEDEGFLELYVSKSRPIMTGNALAPNYLAGGGGGYTFEGDNNTSGLWLNSRNEPSIRVGGREVASFPSGTIDVETSPAETVLTVGVFQRLMTTLQDTICPVGNSIISARSENPKTYLKFGEWELDLQGRALVGVSTSVSNSTPEWVKIVDNEFGEYTHVLTIPELPSIDLPAEANQRLFLRWLGWHQSLNRSGGYDQPVSAPTEIPLFKGENQPHNIVQPSQTKYIWTRTA